MTSFPCYKPAATSSPSLACSAPPLALGTWWPLNAGCQVADALPGKKNVIYLHMVGGRRRWTCTTTS
ncbi:MAG: hypothetical protein U0746_08645 [Gemmataceae bacterium]